MWRVSRFIELTRSADGDSIWVNPEHIDAVAPDDAGASIFLAGTYLPTKVAQTPTDVIAIIDAYDAGFDDFHFAPAVEVTDAMVKAGLATLEFRGWCTDADNGDFRAAIESAKLQAKREADMKVQREFFRRWNVNESWPFRR